MLNEGWISYAGPSITQADVDAVLDAARNGFYENYRENVTKLEELVCSILNVEFALATNSATSALHLALAASGVGSGDEVITTNVSCVASAMPILHCDAVPVLVDVDVETWCVSPLAIERAITDRTKAILPVHWNGHPCDMREILRIARKYELIVVEDAAAAFGAKSQGAAVGALGDVGCFSFQGAKIAIGGQGGVLVTNDRELYERARVLASYGRTDSHGTYWSDYVGWNYGMANLPAALATSQLSRLGELLAYKQMIFTAYKSQLAAIEGVRIVDSSAGDQSTYCYPTIEVLPEAGLSRDQFLDALRRSRIDARPTQPQISQMPMFESRYETPNARAAADKGIILPSAFRLSEEDVHQVASRIGEILKGK